MHSRCIPAHSRRILDILAGFEVACRFDCPLKAIRCFECCWNAITARKNIELECSQSAVKIHIEYHSAFVHFECTSNVFSMIKKIGQATGMGRNIWNAVRRQAEFFKCTSNIQECRKNFHSDGIPAHSASSVTIQGGPKITERHTSGNKDIRWLVSVDGVSSPEKNDTKISHFG